MITRLTNEQCRRLRDARRLKGLTQSALAQQLGCRQSAVSMLENGRGDALSQETLARLAELLDVSLAHAPAPEPERRGRVFCPQPECPSNVPFAVNGELIFWPRPQPGNRGGRHCAFCGEVLASGCPACGEPVCDEAACCRACGAALIPPPALIGEAADAWAAERRRQIADWRAQIT